MSTLQELEIYLNTDFGNDQICIGKCKPTKNQYYYRAGQYYIVQINNDKFMICSDDNKTRHLLNENVFYFNGHYAVTTRKDNHNGVISFHRLYLECLSPNIGDHINRNRADNRSYNLRSVTYTENNRNKSISSKNTSGKQGVSRCMMNDKPYWRCHIVNNDGKLKFASFNINSLGHDLAFNLACAKRREWEQENGYIGA